MIWLVLFFLLFLSAVYILWPLFSAKAPNITHDSELADYFAKVKSIDEKLARNTENGEGLNREELQAEKLELQKRILQKSDKISKNKKPLFAGLLGVMMILSGFGLYQFLGRADLSKAVVQNVNAKPDEKEVKLRQLVEQLGEKLKQPAFANDPTGWRLYAHSLMSIGEYERAEKAYERAVSLDPDNKKLAEEAQSASSFIERQKAIQNLSPAQQEEMIINMVEGLSEKLKTNPKDIEGWVRLLRARKVLGQEEKTRQEIKRMQQVFADNPEIATEILKRAGY